MPAIMLRFVVNSPVFFVTKNKGPSRPQFYLISSSLWPELLNWPAQIPICSFVLDLIRTGFDQSMHQWEIAKKGVETIRLTKEDGRIRDRDVWKAGMCALLSTGMNKNYEPWITLWLQWVLCMSSLATIATNIVPTWPPYVIGRRREW